MKISLMRVAMMAVVLGINTSTFAEVVNINKANSAALSHHLKGIGTKKADAIVAYRNEHGLFGSVEELTNVKGVGKGILAKNLKDLSIKEGVVALVKTKKVPVVLDKKPLEESASKKVSIPKQETAKVDVK